MGRRTSPFRASGLLLAAPFVLLSLTLTTAFQLVPGQDKFQEGQAIDVFVEPLQGRFKRVGLHDLPLCQSPDLSEAAPRRIADLFKPPLYKTIYDIKALKTEVCKLLCVSPKIASQGQPSQNLLSLLMHDNRHERSVAFHVAGRQLEGHGPGNRSSHSPGRITLGFKSPDDFFVNNHVSSAASRFVNHVSFFFEYTPVGTSAGGLELFSITRASAEAKSIATLPHTISQCEQQSLHQRYAGDVLFTYSTHWTMRPMSQRPNAGSHEPSGDALQLLLVVVGAALACVLGLSASWRLLWQKLCSHSIGRLGADAGGYSKVPAQRPVLGTPRWPETLAALAGSGVLAAGLLFLASTCQLHQPAPAILLLALLGVSCGALTSWLCAQLHQQPMSAYSLILVSTLPTTLVLGILWTVEALLSGEFQRHVAASAASALTTSLLTICCAAFAGSLLLTSRLGGACTGERHLGFLPVPVLPPKTVSPRLLWLVSGAWMLLAGSLSLLVVLYWPWRGMRMALLVACSIHVVATSQLAALLAIVATLCPDDGQWLWRAFWTAFVGGLALGAGTCLVFLERAALRGHPVVAGFLLPCASFGLVLGFTSAGLCVTVCAWFLKTSIGGAQVTVLA